MNFQCDWPRRRGDTKLVNHFHSRFHFRVPYPWNESLRRFPPCRRHSASVLTWICQVQSELAMKVPPIPRSLKNISAPLSDSSAADERMNAPISRPPQQACSAPPTQKTPFHSPVNKGDEHLIHAPAYRSNAPQTQRLFWAFLGAIQSQQWRTFSVCSFACNTHWSDRSNVCTHVCYPRSAAGHKGD